MVGPEHIAILDSTLIKDGRNARCRPTADIPASRRTLGATKADAPLNRARTRPSATSTTKRTTPSQCYLFCSVGGLRKRTTLVLLPRSSMCSPYDHRLAGSVLLLACASM